MDAVIYFVVAFCFFIPAYLYWVDLDRRTESFDDDCLKSIEEDRAFRGVRDNLQSGNYLITSDSRTSRVRTILRATIKERGGIREPDKIVPIDEDSFYERKKVVILERAKELTPGKNVIDQDLTTALENYYAWRLAIAKEEVSSEVIAHFKSNLEEYDHSDRIHELSDNDNFNGVSLLDVADDSLNTLDDIFLPLISRVEENCVDSSGDVESIEEELERCRSFLMLCFWGLYRKNMKGVLYNDETDPDECEKKCRQSIREENNIGYWLLTQNGCEESDFKEFRHLGWRFKEVIDTYWDFSNCYKLHPPGDAVTDIPYIEEPFFIYHKDKDEFDPDDPVRERKRGSHKYRKKEEYKE